MGTRMVVFGAVALVSAFAAAAAVAGPLYPVYEISTQDLPDLHDGSLADWEAAVPGASLTHDDFASIPADCGDCAPVDAADLAYRIYLGWHACTQTLWIGVERVDDEFIAATTGAASSTGWLSDTTEWMVDGDHSGGQYDAFVEEDLSALGWSSPAEGIKVLTGYHAQRYCLVPEAAGGFVVGSSASASGWCTDAPWAGASGRVRGVAPATSVVEAFVTPWDALDWHGAECSTRSGLWNGRVIGFQISMPDWDEVGTLHAFHTISGLGSAWRTADSFVSGELVPCFHGDCGAPEGCHGSAVLAESWGRIKAALR